MDDEQQEIKKTIESYRQQLEVATNNRNKIVEIDSSQWKCFDEEREIIIKLIISTQKLLLLEENRSIGKP